jgi:NTE family protein
MDARTEMMASNPDDLQRSSESPEALAERRLFGQVALALQDGEASGGVKHLGFYTTGPLCRTLPDCMDFDLLSERQPRFTAGPVDVLWGEMHYFDTRIMSLASEHIMVSGAPLLAFPTIRIDDQIYWDGGICSNTPVEVVFDDKPRRASLIFVVNMWQPREEEPKTIWQALSRRYASGAKIHVARREQIHRLCHVIREPEKSLTPRAARARPAVRELKAYGCDTTMHLTRPLSPRLGREGRTKDSDFAPGRINSGWQAGVHRENLGG